MEMCFRNIKKSLQKQRKKFKSTKKTASRDKDHTLKSVRILCRMKLEMLCEEIASYCLTVMVFKEIEIHVHSV